MPARSKCPSLQQPHAAAHRGRSPPTCLRLPSGPERRALAAWMPKRGCSGALLPAQSSRCHRLWPSRNASTGKTEYSAGPRATLTRDMAASDSFVKSL